MKLRSLFSAFALGIFAFGAATGFAQDEEEPDPLNPKAAKPRIYIGPVFGYNRAMHTGEFQSIPPDVSQPGVDNPVPCPIFDGGTNNGFYAGMTIEFLLGKRATTGEDPVSSIIGKIVYNSLPGSFDVPGLEYKVVNEAGTPISTTVKHVSEVKYQTIDAEVLYKLNLFGSSFGVVAGPTVGFALGTAQQERSFSLIEPSNAQFYRDPNVPTDLEYTNNDRTIIIDKGDLDGASGLRLGLKAGVQYEQRIFNNLNLVPHIFYNFGITKLTDGENWRVNALQAGVDLRFAL